MDLELSLARRFREDSLSDLLIASFLQIPGLPVVVRTPNETRTGSDFDLALVDPASGTAIQYRIQAKRLGKPTASWKTRSYRELAHPHGTGEQVEILCDLTNLEKEVISTIPLYAFYNPYSICESAGISGIALADAFEIEAHIFGALDTVPRPHFKQLQSVKPYFFDLSSILCPPATAPNRLIATPSQSRDAFEKLRSELPRSPFSTQSVKASLKRPHKIEVGAIPSELLSALRISETTRIVTADLDRPQLVIATSEILNARD